MESKSSARDAGEWDFTVTGGVKGEPVTHTVTWDGRSTQPRTSIPDPIVPISRSFVSLTWRVVLNTQGNGML